MHLFSTIPLYGNLKESPDLLGHASHCCHPKMLFRGRLNASPRRTRAFLSGLLETGTKLSRAPSNKRMTSIDFCTNTITTCGNIDRDRTSQSTNAKRLSTCGRMQIQLVFSKLMAAAPAKQQAQVAFGPLDKRKSSVL